MPYLVRIPDPVVSNKFWVGADSVIHLPPKPKVTKAVMDWYERDKNSNWNVNGYLNNAPEELYEWLLYSDDVLKNQHALATLVTYGPEAVEVEREKRYRVKLTATEQYLRKFYGKYEFTDIEVDYFNKQELIEAGFEGMFDNPMFEVEEVE
ncbi:DUF1642 domain-containing protein [Streptococcus sp. 121]|nr:DUF1642 domain-containing protein [Streptococcus sp. 121]